MTEDENIKRQWDTYINKKKDEASLLKGQINAIYQNMPKGPSKPTYGWIQKLVQENVDLWTTLLSQYRTILKDEYVLEENRNVTLENKKLVEKDRALIKLILGLEEDASSKELAENAKVLGELFKELRNRRDSRNGEEGIVRP
ncbi:MAG: hypothetical protein ABSB40_12260 [Nitrososphaeria archaeon]|jgi:hypothetical protein